MSEPLIQLENVGFCYEDHSVLHDVNLALHSGECIGITGSIGSGKTTLLHLIVGLIKPSSGLVHAFGQVRTEEKDFHEVRRKAGLVFQDPDNQLFCPTVIEDVAFGPLNLGKGIAGAKQAAGDALKRVGLTGFEDRTTYKLSGGEKRLVALASVLAMEPEVLLLDEPTASLDKDSVSRITETLSGLRQSMIIVSHNHDFLESITGRCLNLDAGRL